MPQRTQLPIRHAYQRLFSELGRDLRALEGIVRRDAVALDVGANLGAYSYAFAGFCRAVEAFEPNPRCASAIRLHDHPRIRVHEVALSDAEGVAELFVPRDETGEHHASATIEQRVGDGARIGVRTVTLDSFGFSDVGLLKIDVEGHERRVLRGARGLIARERPVLHIEIEQRHLDVPIEDVLAEVQGVGYEGWFLDGGRRLPLHAFDARRDQPTRHGRPTGDRYVRNFIFTPRSTPGTF